MKPDYDLYFTKIPNKMSEFELYLKMGFEHISDIQGYDHILFITALCAVYQLKDWKKILVLVTAFTIGHSITLALATSNIIPRNAEWIEFLIPITILLTCALNFVQKNEGSGQKNTRYLTAIGFGLIHGMGFSNFLSALLGGTDDILIPLLSFNLGLELGQILIVLIVLLISYGLISGLKIVAREWNLVLSGGSAGIALIMALERIPF